MINVGTINSYKNILKVRVGTYLPNIIRDVYSSGDHKKDPRFFLGLHCIFSNPVLGWLVKFNYHLTSRKPVVKSKDVIRTA